MNTKDITRILILVLLSSCCSKIKITVDTFDKQALVNSTEYTQAKLIHFERTLNYKINSLEKDFIGQFDQIYKEISANPAVPKGSSLKTDLFIEMEKIQSNSNKHYFEGLESLKQNSRELLKTKDFSNIEICELKGDKAFIDGLEKLTKVLEGLGIIGESLADARSIILNTHWNSKFTSKTSFGESIYADQFSSFITRAPNKYWRKYENSFDIVNDTLGSRSLHLKARYNRVTAKTFFGNSDIAIKMDNPGTFTVKGVRMDANESIKASFKVLNQGIKYLGYTVGIPISTTSDNNNNLSETINENSLELYSSLSYIDGVRKDISIKEERIENLTKAYLMSIIDRGILLEEPNISEEEKKSIISNIKRMQALYEKQLKN
ncbi:hypothetical protein ACFOUP_13030 [Belliella kenyensis]|uniref:Lipoprotein n=1 Tax=Belliella kenyensis TaxID=1472724 RepID=A0ABV8EQ69_9BACT|nr:hypothetical protein [Belliella kenyensis]MCH7403814.1 hypothetical protein [Belliella kenyensis]MDN3601814.1 hypothetical protein [Belliella kenyensis]